MPSRARWFSRAAAASRSTSAGTRTGSASGPAALETAARAGTAPPDGPRQRPKTNRVACSESRPGAGARQKLSFNERREFAALPGRIDALEAEVRRLDEAIAGPEFYREGSEEIARTLARADEARGELDEAYARWIDLEPRSG